MIDDILRNSLSGFLKAKKKESEGLFTEIFVMDNKGMNVGQSDITSDYWQGDEAKWIKTYANAQTVAAATEQLSASLRQVGDQITNCANITQRETEQAEQTNSEIITLSENAEKSATWWR